MTKSNNKNNEKILVLSRFEVIGFFGIHKHRIITKLSNDCYKISQGHFLGSNTKVAYSKDLESAIKSKLSELSCEPNNNKDLDVKTWEIDKLKW